MYCWTSFCFSCSHLEGCPSLPGLCPPSPCADWQLWKLVKTLTNLVLTTQCWNSLRLMDSGLQHLTQNWTLLAKFGCFCHKDCEPLYVRELFQYLFCVCPLEVGNNILCGSVFIYLLHGQYHLNFVCWWKWAARQHGVQITFSTTNAGT